MTELSSTARSGRSTSGWLSGWPGRMGTARTSGGPLAPLPPHSASPPHRNPYTHTHTSPTGVRGEPHSTSPLAPHRHSYTHKPDTHTHPVWPPPCPAHTRDFAVHRPPASHKRVERCWLAERTARFRRTEPATDPLLAALELDEVRASSCLTIPPGPKNLLLSSSFGRLQIASAAADRSPAGWPPARQDVAVAVALCWRCLARGRPRRFMAAGGWRLSWRRLAVTCGVG